MQPCATCLTFSNERLRKRYERVDLVEADRVVTGM
jgi:hypothetical protein